MATTTTDTEPSPHELASMAAAFADPLRLQYEIINLDSTDKDLRSAAYGFVAFGKKHFVDHLVNNLAFLLNSSSVITVRFLAAAFFHKVLVGGSGDEDGEESNGVWNLLLPRTRHSVKVALLVGLQGERDEFVVEKVLHSVNRLAVLILPRGGWPDLVLELLKGANWSEWKRRKRALVVIGHLPMTVGECLVPFADELRSVLFDCFGDVWNVDVRIAALTASVNFILLLKNGSDRDRFQELLLSLVGTMIEALYEERETVFLFSLSALIKLAKMGLRFSTVQLIGVLGVMMQIGVATEFVRFEKTWQMAVEFVVTLSEAGVRVPRMMRMLNGFVRLLFPILLDMLLDIEDETEWHDADEDDRMSNRYRFGQEWLNRFSISLGGNAIEPVASELLPTYWDAAQWKKRQAALICLGQMAEGCSEVMKKTLDKLISIILKLFNDPHPRVRWAAIDCIGQLSIHLGPDVQMQFHGIILPALVSTMNDTQNPRLQAHATSAVIKFSQNGDLEALRPDLDGVVVKLLDFLQHAKQMVREEALTTLWSVADSFKESFQKHYDIVMPRLKAILMNGKDTDEIDKMLRAKTLECIALVGRSVGMEKFEDDSKLPWFFLSRPFSGLEALVNCLFVPDDS